MMRQYLELKEKYQDCILFFRLGDFYEMFFDDAKLASKELELTLTGKDCGLSERAPMCGVPYHAASAYISRLIEKGYKVAVCEQLTDPALSKGLVERDVIRIVTPGTVADPSQLDEKSACYVLCVAFVGKAAALAYADVSTGELIAHLLNDAQRTLRDELMRIRPREIVTNDMEQANPASWRNHQLHRPARFGFPEEKRAARAAGTFQGALAHRSWPGRARPALPRGGGAFDLSQ